jgi:hypothetical protein
MTEEISSNDKKQLKENEGSGVNLGRHQAQCTICSSPSCQAIEEAFVGWRSTEVIAHKYGVSRDAQYRHAHAFGLFGKRQRNIRMALEGIIERVDCTPINGSVIVSAIKAYAKMNSLEQGVDQAQGSNPKKLFERMSEEEREAFARDGSLPDWFSRAIGATPSDGQEGEKESEVTETKGLQ